jgi:hypothetical protein
VHHRNKVQCSCIHCFFAGGGHFGAEPRWASTAQCWKTEEVLPRQRVTMLLVSLWTT